MKTRRRRQLTCAEECRFYREIYENVARSLRISVFYVNNWLLNFEVEFPKSLKTRFDFFSSKALDKGLLIAYFCGKLLMMKELENTIPENDNIIVYRLTETLTDLQVRIENDTVWLNRQQLALLWFSHDRWLLIDDSVYLFGASLKDLGKKWFGFALLQDVGVDEIMGRIKSSRWRSCIHKLP